MKRFICFKLLNYWYGFEAVYETSCYGYLKKTAMGTRQRILIIDDDPDMLGLCKHLLQAKGFDVMTHLGCDDLFGIVEKFSPHLVFMDHNMPHLCGAEAIRLLKTENRFRHIPVILFSAETNIQQLAKEAGADGWLKKPFNFETIAGMAKKMALAS